MKPLLDWVKTAQLTAAFTVLPAKISEESPGQSAGMSPALRPYGRNEKRYQPAGAWWQAGFQGLLAVLMLLTAFLPVYAQPTIQWDKTIGGNEEDALRSLQHTRDGGYILGGYSSSDISGDCPPNGYCPKAYWVVKLDATGNKVWDKTLGGSGFDELISLEQTRDGGYILGGISDSPISGDKTQNSRGGSDYWLVKLDATGSKQWDKTFGGTRLESLTALQQTSDGGFILGGYSNSGASGDKTEANKGNCSPEVSCPTDYWVVKLDADGQKQWDKTFGGDREDWLMALQQTSDGGYILGGRSYSGVSGDKTNASKGSADYWVVKLDAAGHKQWDKTFGGSDWEDMGSLQQTLDGGFILGGSSFSGNGFDKTDANRGEDDYWVVKLDAVGNKVWDKTLGGSGFDELISLEQTRDKGFILGGYSQSSISGEKTDASRGGNDYWLVKLDVAGNKVWDKTLGGNGWDFLEDLKQTSDGGYVLGGFSDSPISGDKTEGARGRNDAWVVKLAPFPETQQVKSFTLIHAQINQPIRVLKDGDTLDLADLPPKPNLRADTDPDMVGSVLFELSGRQTRTYRDNAGPYALFGDTTGPGNAWRPEPGSYTLTATPFSQPDGQGTAGTPLTIRFTVVEKQVSPRVEWDRTIGGNYGDGLRSIRQISDGGYILGGSSTSGISSDKTQDSRGGSDYWVVKLDAAGNKQWDKTLGGNTNDDLDDLQTTRDGGYILSGRSWSGISGDKTEPRKGECSAARGCLPDFWVVKLDAAGNKQWDRTLGGNDDDDHLTSVQQTLDGGYILGGSSDSGISGDKTGNSRGYTDYWVVKLDAAGNKVWDKTIGGNSFDYLYSLQQTSDEGYILAGTSTSGISGEKTEAGRGSADLWVVKLDAAGSKVWDKTLGGSQQDGFMSLPKQVIQQTRDGGYILGGYSNSGISGDKTEASRGGTDYWVIRLNAAGSKVWDKTIGGDNTEAFQYLEQTTDSGFILGGSSASGISGEKTAASKGEGDYWVVKLDATGNKQWDKTIGGNGGDGFSALQQTLDGGYVLGGSSASPISGDKTENSKGSSDYWVVKLAPFPESPQVESFTLLNATTGQPLRTLNNGDIIHLADLPTRKLNIRADTDPDAVGSVKFRLRGRLKITRLDNEKPYALFGDNDGHYNQWTPAPGRYMLTATPFPQPDAKGKAGTPLTIHFTVARKPAATVAQRREQAPPAARTELAPTVVLYPNPTSDGLLQVRLTGEGQGPVRYSLLSAAGRKLAEGTVRLTDAGNQLKFDFSRQLRIPGLYYLRLEGANGRQTFKIMRR